MKNRLDIDPNGDKWLYKNNVFHRIGGPAIEWKNGKKVWWLYGKQYKESEYIHLVSNLPLLYYERFKKGEWI